MSHIVLIQGSMKPASRTAIVMAEVKAVMEEKGVPHGVIDLRELDNQFCDGRDIVDYNESVRGAFARLKEADGYVIGMPVYQYSVAGPLKNFLDIQLPAMEGKVAGIVCNSGGPRSYLASADLMKMLSFEGDVTTVQPIVQTSKGDFADGKLTNDLIRPRIVRMVDTLLHDL